MRTQSEIIQDALDRMQWTAARLAKEIGKSPQFVGNVLRGERKVTSAPTIYSIAQALRIDSDDLFLALDRIPPDVVDTLAANPRIMSNVRAYIATLTDTSEKRAGQPRGKGEA